MEMDFGQFITGILGQESIFLSLFLYMLWQMLQDKKKQQDLMTMQAEALQDLTSSFEKLTDNQERITNRLDDIEAKIENKQ